MESRECPACGQTVLWVRSVNSIGLLCLDAEPNPKGGVALVDSLGVVLRHDPIEALMGGERYTQHLETCEGKKRNG